MKNVLLFVAIITVCGSSMKAPVIRMCQTELNIKYYLKGKLILTTSRGYLYSNMGGYSHVYDWPAKKTFYADSMTVEPKYKMLDK